MGIRLIDKLKSGTSLAALVSCAVCALPAGTLQAQTVTETLTADLSNFIDISGNTPSPVSAIDASFTITFDPNAGYIAPTTSGLTVNSFTGTTVAYPLEYAWNPTLDVLTVGASPRVGLIYAGSSDVVFQFNLSNMSAPKLSLCSDPGFTCGSGQGNSLYYSSGYTLASDSHDGWLATVANGVSANPPPAAPEIDPASATAALTLLIGGLLVVNGRRQSTSPVAG